MLKAVTKLRRQIPSWITDLKLAMNAHSNCGSDMGWVSPGYISFSGSVRLVMVYMYVCRYVCVCPVPAKQPHQMKPIPGWLTHHTPWMIFTPKSLGRLDKPLHERIRMPTMLLTEDLKHDMHTHNDSGSEMGWVPPCHTSFFGHVLLKMPKW